MKQSDHSADFSRVPSNLADEELIEKSKVVVAMKNFLNRPQDKFLKSEVKDVLQTFFKPSMRAEFPPGKSESHMEIKSEAIERLDELLRKFKEKSR